MHEDNTTFIGSDPFWANACVGENGSPGYWDYAKGFSQAAAILIDLVLQDGGMVYPVDELVYPVCFNMRHSVELRLKGAISELISIEKCRGHILEFDLAGSHNIGNIWEFFVEKSQMVDDRYKDIIDCLNKKVCDFAEVDPTGQTFRYPLNTESQKHLVDVANINFVVLKHSFTCLEAALDDLHRLNKYLRDEYATGTFTKKMSRKNLFELTAFLPPRSTWSDESFDVTKNKIKGRFEIGGKELSDSIKHIETHFEFAPNIEITVPMLGVVDADLVEFFCHWFKLHDLSPDNRHVGIVSSMGGADEMFQSMIKNSEIRDSVWKEVQPALTPEKLAGLSALFYFAREMDFSETYKRIFVIEHQEAQATIAASKNSFRLNYFHIFDKTTATCNMLKALYFLKKIELADRLVVTHCLEQKISWLNEARSRVLFRKPDYCGYGI